MTTNLSSKSIIDPDLQDLSVLQKRDIMTSIFCCMPGQIQSFNSSKFTAQVQPLFKRVLSDGEIQAYPLLVDVPVITPQGGGAALFFPIAAGDQCLLFFADRNINAWFKNGSQAAPADPRCHDLSDAFAFVGVNSLSGLLSGFVANETGLNFGGAKIAIKAGLVTIQNGTTTLLTLLQNLCIILEGLTIQDGATTLPLTATSITAITNFATTLAGLLY